MERTSPRGTLLLVEDDASFAFCAAEFLARRGFEVAQARDLDSALVLLAAQRWAAVVTDLDLTGRHTRDGLEVVAAAARFEPRPVIFVWTGSATTEVRQEAFRLGADLVVEKGSLWDLEARLRVCLAERPSRVASWPEDVESVPPPGLTAGSEKTPESASAGGRR